MTKKNYLQVSIRELHIIMLSPPEKGGQTETRDADNNIITSYSNLYNLLPTQLKNMTS